MSDEQPREHIRLGPNIHVGWRGMSGSKQQPKQGQWQRLRLRLRENAAKPNTGGRAGAGAVREGEQGEG